MEAKVNNKQLLSIAASISMVLLSTSAFLFSVNRTFAESPYPKTEFNTFKKIGVSSGCEVYPFGIVSGKAYWIEYNNSGWNFKASEISKWTD